MQWVKYLMGGMFLCFVAAAAWLVYTRQYGAAAGMLFPAAVIAVLYLLVWQPHVRQDALMRRLQAGGIRAQALVVGVKGTSSYLNELPIMRVNVRYTIDGKAHNGVVKQAIPFQALAAVQPGKQISVLVDPEQTTSFVLTF